MRLPVHGGSMFYRSLIMRAGRTIVHVKNWDGPRIINYSEINRKLIANVLESSEFLEHGGTDV